MRNVILIGFGVDGEKFNEYSKLDNNSQVAARKLELRYIKGLIQAGFRVNSISSFPASTFPGNKKIFFGFGFNKISQEYEISTAGFINLPGCKLVTRLLSVVTLLVVKLLREGGRPSVIIYSLHQPYVLAGLVSKFIFRCNVYVIVPDLPLLMRTGSKTSAFIQWMKEIDSRFLRYGSSFFDGATFICSSMRLHLPELSGNSIVIDGIVDNPIEEHQLESLESHYNLRGKKIILYTGQLVESYGVKLLLGAIANLPDDYEIWIAGAGELRCEVERAAVKDSRLKYLGLLSPNQVSLAYMRATLLINPRLLDSEFVRFSFPSKLLEYLTSGVPVLSSRLPSMEDDLIPFLSFIDELTAAGVANAIQTVCSENYLHAVRTALDARSYVYESRSANNQVAKLISIMDA